MSPIFPDLVSPLFLEEACYIHKYMYLSTYIQTNLPSTDRASMSSV